MAGPKHPDLIGAHMDVARAAALLDMTPRWVKDKIKAGDLQGYRLGQKVIVSVESLRLYLDNNSMGQQRNGSGPVTA
jgi:hypothetical protein